MSYSISIANQKEIERALRNEITEYHIYKKLAKSVKNAENKKVLEDIAHDEIVHYNALKQYVSNPIKPNRLKIFFYFLIGKILGLTFAVKLLEKGEVQAKIDYEELTPLCPEAAQIAIDEEEHEKALIALIDEERLKYIGSIVLGLNDALVELTGALAGFTYALQNPKLIASTGLITGIAASLSMAASEYLATKHDKDGKQPIKASLYTGSAYVLVVFFLVLPFFLFSNVFFSLGISVFCAVAVIFIFTYYISITNETPLWPSFFEMVSVSVGVAIISFIIGYAVRHWIGIEV